jgi:chorismate mutase
MDDPAKDDVIDELARCREEIERIDDQLLALLVRRVATGRRTGELKREAGLPIVDPVREADVIRRVAESARAAGLPSEPIREIFWQIVEMSRRAQEAES